MEKKVTIVELAKMAEVSTATVSRIINNTGKVNEDTKKKVLELIEKYNYKPNVMAKSLKMNKSNMVGFVVPHINSPYYAQIFYETELIARERGFTLMLCNSESNAQLESDILNAFIATQVRAIVFMGGRLDDSLCDPKFLRELESVNKMIPVIACVDVPGLDCTHIFQEEEESTDQLIHYMAEKGYQDVLLMGGYSQVRTTSVRRKKIIKYAKQYGINIRQEIIDCDYSADGGNIAMQELIEKGNLPQAIICINDLVATGALNELYKNSLQVPQDVAIVGYDDLATSKFIYPGITTIGCNYKEYSKAIVKAIEEIETNKIGNVKIPTELVVRGTT